MFGGRLSDCYLLDLEVVEVIDQRPGLRAITFGSSDLIDFTWAAGQDLMLEVRGEHAVRRRYTIRRSDPVSGTLEIEVVLHGSGPFARWASNATVGDRIQGIGPRGVIGLKPDAPHHLFAGDESAEPAINVMIEALPPTATANAVLGTDTEVVEQMRTIATKAYWRRDRANESHGEPGRD